MAEHLKKIIANIAPAATQMLIMLQIHKNVALGFIRYITTPAIRKKTAATVGFRTPKQRNIAMICTLFESLKNQKHEKQVKLILQNRKEFINYHFKFKLLYALTSNVLHSLIQLQPEAELHWDRTPSQVKVPSQGSSV